MPVLSAANVIQAKTGNALAINPASVTLDNPTGEGGTLTLEIAGPITFPSPPDGWDYDGNNQAMQWAYHLCPTIAGQTSWDFDTGLATDWLWRITEWDTVLDSISPLDAQPAGGFASDTGVTTLSTGTTVISNRAETVALAWHYWRFVGNSAQTFDWSGHTNGFTERDEARVSGSTAEYDGCWSWLFSDTAATFETTATVNTTPRHAGDTYYATVVVYAAAQPEIVAGPTVSAVG